MAIPNPGGGAMVSRRTKTLLLTVIGEVLLSMPGPVWQEVLIDSLTTLGSTVAAARQGVARAIGDGWITSERVGRRSRVSVPEVTAKGLLAGRGRLMEFGRPRSWDGDWLFVALTVPEESRSLRHHFRTELAWLGFGSLGNGLWVSPHTENEAATIRLLDSREGPRGAYVFTSAKAATHTPRQIADAAWDLEDLRERYDVFCSTFEAANPLTPAATFACWIELFTSWRHFPLHDPELPDSLLPSDWPRRRAYQLFHLRLDQWTGPALEYFRELELDVLAS